MAATLLGGALLAACGGAHPAAGGTAGASQGAAGASGAGQAPTAACATGPAGTAAFTLAVAMEPDGGVSKPAGKCWAAIQYTGIDNASTGTAQAGDTGQFKVAWNAQNLYILAWIQEWPLNANGSELYENDSIEFYLAGDGSKEQGSYGPNDCQVTVDYTGQVATDDTCNTSRTFTPVEQVVPNKGYYSELIVPWTTLNVAKADAGQQYAFSIANDISDSSGTNRLVQMQWAGGENDNWQQTADWGTITLK